MVMTLLRSDAAGSAFQVFLLRTKGAPRAAPGSTPLDHGPGVSYQHPGRRALPHRLRARLHTERCPQGELRAAIAAPPAAAPESAASTGGTDQVRRLGARAPGLVLAAQAVTLGASVPRDRARASSTSTVTTTTA